MKRNAELGFVVSLHLAVFDADVYPPNTAADLAVGGASVILLAVTLFVESS